MSILSRMFGSEPPPTGTEGNGQAPPAHAPLSAAPLLAALPDPAMLLSRSGIVTEANVRAFDVFPLLRVGAPLSQSLRVPDVLETVKAVAASGQPASIEYVDRVPVERWTEAHIGFVPNWNGEPLLLLLLRDMTPARRAERMRADFVANASHELRTPLASLLGFVETLQGPARDDVTARTRFLEIMRVQATRMARLIDDLLSLSRIELRAHLRPDQAVDLVSVASQVGDALGHLAAERGVVLTVKAKSRPVTIDGDRDELIRVVENLTENAIKYGGSGGRVDIEVEETEGTGRPEARLAVRDYGAGISWEHLPRLTERFYRVDVADSREKGGTGLGLALVKHIVARHRGRLDITSQPGDGACFAVIVPLAGQPAGTVSGRADERHPGVIQSS